MAAIVLGTACSVLTHSFFCWCPGANTAFSRWRNHLHALGQIRLARRHLGKISEKFTTATPRLFSKFNYRIKWFDGWENHMLVLDNYSSGLSAPYKSWCLLEKVVEEA